ncbi:hypothetical protein JHK82_053635 [Glycine max]|nr:hypothetical protein JHK85_054430 [Glycine max]KAG5086238.1 hypothetical protein JHK82_053635 [Glycine max]
MKNKETGTARQFKDMLDVLLDMHEDKNAEIKLDKKNIKAFIMVVPVNLAIIIQCFQWKLVGGNGKVDMEEKSGITLPRANPIICVPVPRINPFLTM